MARIAIIGSGFSGLSAACYLSASGHEVHVYEKNAEIGGRARQLKTDNGYVFDMGPSWYWMPDVFENFYADFGHTVSDFYDLKLLDPAFDVVFAQKEVMHVPADFDELCQMFESIEAGSAKKLCEFMDDARYKYEVGMKSLSKMPGLSIAEILNWEFLKGALHLDVFSSFSKHIAHYFTNPKLLALMEFPVLFLGAMPKDTPALYSLMNYAGLKLGTWYPDGGFGKVIDSFASIAKKRGAQIHLNAAVSKIVHQEQTVSGIVVSNEELQFDAVIASADYHHVEQELLDDANRNYPEKYWDKKTFAPSCLIFYLGIKKQIKNIAHHTLFFENDLVEHSHEIYKDPKWPTQPLFYACCPSKSDVSVAPPGHENIFLLMPVAIDLRDTEQLREQYFREMIGRLEAHVGEEISAHIDYKKSYCVSDFKSDYNAYKGNAYGLANTLMQTANLKPKIKNSKIQHLYYAGQLTVPGPGVPPAIISGKLAAEQVLKQLKKRL